MKSTESAAGKPSQLHKILDRLRNPLQLRIFLVVTLILSWYVGLATPLTTQIEDTTRLLSKERKRLELGQEIEGLRDQVGKYKNRIPAKSDSNEWLQYVLEGVRRYPLKLGAIDADKPREMGPYKSVVLKLEIEGKYKDVNAFLRWVEGNDRIMRIDVLRLEPSRGFPDGVGARLIVLGVTG